MTNSSAPAGWYPAPHAEGDLRYWDGAVWLDIAPPGAAPTPVTVPSATPVLTRRLPRISGLAWTLGIPAIVLAGALIIAYGSGAAKTPSTAAVEEEPQAPAPSLPAGYSNLGGGLGLGGKWLDKPCSLGTGGCNHMEVYSLNGCPDALYIEVNLLDSAGRVIGYTNDMVGAVSAKQRAVLEFRYFEDAARVEVSDVSCY